MRASALVKLFVAPFLTPNPSVLFFVCLSLLSPVLCAPTFAQDQPATGFPPFSSQVGGPFDKVNLANGTVSQLLPLRSKSGPIPFASQMFSASYAYLVPQSHGYMWQMPIPGFFPALNMGASLWYSLSSISTCNGKPDNYYGSFEVRDPYGTAHPLPVTLILDQYGCQPLPSGPVKTTDGSGYTVVFTGYITYNLYDKYGNSYSYASAQNSTTLTTPDGVTMVTSVSPPGNTTLVVTDSLSSTPILTVNYPGAGPYQFTYTDAAGHTQTYTENFSKVTQVTNFGCPNDAEFPDPGVEAPTTITTPDGGTYTITYETTPNYSSTKYPPPYVTGRIAKIELPSGGYISYTYSGGNNGISCGSWVVPTLTRTLNDGAGNSSTWTYVNSNTAEPFNANFTVTETDPAGNQIVHYFAGQFQTQTLTYEGGCPTSILGCHGGGTLLRTITTCFNGVFSSCAVPVTGIDLPILQTDVYTSYNGSSSNLVETKYDNTYGNVLEVKQYDYGAAMPPTGSPLSDTLTSYGQSWNGSSCSSYPTGTYIFTTPCYSHTKNSSGVDVAKTQITYSNTGHPTSTAQWVSGSSWLTSTATYNGNGTIKTASDVNQALYTYSYSGTGGCNGLLPTSVTVTGSGLSGALATSSTWDCNGGVETSVTDANGQKTTTNYEQGGTGDPLYRPVSVVDPLGNVTTYSYTLKSFETAMTFGNSTTDVLTTTDGLRRPIFSQTRQGPSSSTFDSTQTVYGWTTTGPLTKISVPYPGTAGQPAPGGTAVTTTQYDALHRPLTVTDGGGGTVTYTYVKNDILQSLGPAPSGESLKRRQFEYDGLGRLTSVCELTSATGSGSCGQSNAATGYWAQYNYDVLGDLISVNQNAQSANKQTRGYTYDGLGRLTSEANPESGTENYYYDSDSTMCGNGVQTFHGDLVKTIDAAGNCIAMFYDALHRLTDVGNSNQSVSHCKRFRYDNSSGYPGSTKPSGLTNTLGRLVEAATDQCVTGNDAIITDEWFSYTALGQPSTVHESTPHSGGYYGTGAAYYPNGVPSSINGMVYSVNYNLDGEGRINSTSNVAGQNLLTSVSYNTASQPTQVNFGSLDSDTFTYDSNSGRMKQYKFSVNGQSVTGTLNWNAIGTLGSLAITDQFYGPDNQTCSYTHDDLSRIASANCGSPWSQTFSYDAFGNISKSGTISFQPTYSYLTNHMTQIGSSSPTYDGNGNVLNDTAHSYTWDVYGKPLSIDGVTLTYDALGDMVEQNRNGSYTEIDYAPTGAKLQLLQGQIGIKDFNWLPGGAVAVDLASVGGLAYYRHSDWLGSSRLASTPSRTIYYDGAYAPFGESYAQTGTTDLSFTGMNQDTVGNLFDFPAREYNDIHGRWPSPDPAGLAAVDPGDPQTWNRYAYVRNSPLNTTDPSGLDDEGNNPIYDCTFDVFCNLFVFPINPPSAFLPDNNPPIDWQTILFGPLDPSLVIFNWSACYDASGKMVQCTDPSAVIDCDDSLHADVPAPQQAVGACANLIPQAVVFKTRWIKEQCINQFNDTSAGKVANFFSLASPVIGPDRRSSTIEDVGSTTIKYGFYQFFKTASRTMARTPFGSMSGFAAEAIQAIAKELVVPAVVGATGLQILAHAGCDTTARQATGQMNPLPPGIYY